LTRPGKLLKQGLHELGLELTGAMEGSFMLYLEELKKWNRAYSLTSLRTDEDIVIKHFLDSCLYLEAFTGDEVQSIADVGSGAGLPGIPLKILRPGLKAWLIETVGKKAAFLRHITRVLGLGGTEVIEKRVQDVEGIRADAAVTRALFRAGEFYENSRHIVKDGGLLVLNKGPKFRDELKDLTVGYELKKISLPLTDIKRNIIIMRKER
jgi:16S rRNA (guanine527-N7)-methyltransferase